MSIFLGVFFHFFLVDVQKYLFCRCFFRMDDPNDERLQQRSTCRSMCGLARDEAPAAAASAQLNGSRCEPNKRTAKCRQSKDTHTAIVQGCWRQRKNVKFLDSTRPSATPLNWINKRSLTLIYRCNLSALMFDGSRSQRANSAVFIIIIKGLNRITNATMSHSGTHSMSPNLSSLIIKKRPTSAIFHLYHIYLYNM